jgi:hypothetical protein
LVLFLLLLLLPPLLPLQVISGYDHFRESRCNMFDQEEINRWNAMMMWEGQRAQEVEMGQVLLQV